MADPLIGMSFDLTDFRTESDPDSLVARGGLGSQCFPVAELDDDFDGEPQDGMQYLFIVRREAKLQPLVNRVANPFELEQVLDDTDMAESTPRARPDAIHKPDEAWRSSFLDRFEQLRSNLARAPHLSAFPPPSHSELPKPSDESEWRKFIYGRKIRLKPQPQTTPVTATTAVGTVTETETPATDVTLEEMKAAALAELELDAPDAVVSSFTVVPQPQLPTIPLTAPTLKPSPSFVIDPDHPAHAPSPAVLLAMSTPLALRVFTLFGNWLVEKLEDYETISSFVVPSTILIPPSLRKKQQQAASTNQTNPSRTRPSRRRLELPLPNLHEAHWMLSLLTRIESVLDGNDVASLRQVAKTVLTILQQAQAQRRKNMEESGKSSLAASAVQDEEEAEAEAHCWMIVAAIAGHWKQSDLWDHGLN
ncbi:hypothetical protein ACM66B_005787 [Microbotryomycetes sp. NB124-2]